ncbi:Cytochrome b561 domain-containing protein [Caenorhabditis elegans]|uniref:Cytochrome b561 domain-containing protein n=1 Tax=Caenorhabditis elegans TaxID=6239 RepID=O16272_CAEEL|nr:Cytochrome b561 domain-containing protein [Caenorhabditis elegans]CCD65243.2 Cytochrome b561 domain-containing protein [Caenorhabditis elegans]|eukprot:NP_504270.2 Uncharacterized protein CELE_F39G3.4 [Caenorhabditis elegans]
MSSLGYFEFAASVTHLVGFITVCLNGYFFNTFYNGIGWPFELKVGSTDARGLVEMRGKQLHGFLMFLGFIYLQGEALLSYRVYRFTTNRVSILIHTFLHIASIVLAVGALFSIILTIKYTGASHFSNIHSYLGVCLLLVYSGQLSFGFCTYLFKCTPKDYQSRLMPVHRAVGISCMVVACVQCCLGYNQMVSGKLSCFKDLSCANRIEYVGSLSMIFNIIYTIMVVSVVIPKPWRREKETIKIN